MGNVNITDWSKPEYYKTIQFSDIDGDGKVELVARSIDGILAYKFNGTNWSELSVGPEWSDDSGWNQQCYYKTIQCADIDGDGKVELIARSAYCIQVWKYSETGWARMADGPAWSDKENWNQVCYYETIQCADIDGDGKAELIARSAYCIQVWKYSETGWVMMANGPAWSDDSGWNQPCYYETIQCADIDGDGKAELIARSAYCIQVWKYDGTSWSMLPNGPAWSDDSGWNQACYYETIQCADIDGDGKVELIARSAYCIQVWKYSETGWVMMANGPAWSDDSGWNQSCYYETIQCRDIDGDGRDELIARSSDSIEAYKLNNNSWLNLPKGPALSDNSDPIIEVVEISRIDYDFNSAKIISSNVEEIDNFDLPNDTDVSQTMTYSKDESVTETRGWSNSFGVKVGISGTEKVQIGVPVLASEEISITYSIEISDTFTWNQSISTTKSWHLNVPLTVPPHKHYCAHVVVGMSEIMVPYTIYGKMKLKSGAIVKSSIQGIYSGTNSHDIKVNPTIEEIIK